MEEQQTNQPKNLKNTSDAEKDLAQKLDSIGWALFFIWLGVSFLADLGVGYGLLGVGIITIGMQFVRRVYALKAQGFWLVIGLLFIIGACGEIFEVEIPIVPIVLILAGISIIYSLTIGKRQTE